MNQIAIFCKTWGVVWSMTLRKKRWFKKLRKTMVVWTDECMIKIYKNSYNVRMNVEIGLMIVLENNLVHTLKLQVKKMHFESRNLRSCCFKTDIVFWKNFKILKIANELRILHDHVIYKIAINFAENFLINTPILRNIWRRHIYRMWRHKI